MKKKFNYLKNIKTSKVVWYKNPNECSQFNVERVNPNHIGILWGKRKKGSKGRNWMQIAKLYFNILPVVYGISVASWIDAFTGYVYSIIANVSLFSFLIYVFVGLLIYLPVFKEAHIKCRMNGGQF